MFSARLTYCTSYVCKISSTPVTLGISCTKPDIHFSDLCSLFRSVLAVISNQYTKIKLLKFARSVNNNFLLVLPSFSDSDKMLFNTNLTENPDLNSNTELPLYREFR